MIRRGLCKWLLAGVLLLGSLFLCVGLVWFNFQSSAEFNGRYQSIGSVVQSDGQTLEVRHSLMIKDGRFYAMTRQGQTIIKTSGTVESAFRDRLRLRVELGETAQLDQAGGMDNDLLFNLLYGGEKNAIINLRPISDHCHLAVETRQIYCAQADF
jgi:hypothetical protein